MTKENFDAFIAKLLQPSDDTMREILRDAVSDEMENVLKEVAPRIWSVLWRQMSRDPKNSIHLNAVLNAAVVSVFSWIALCTTKKSTGAYDNDKVLKVKVLACLDHALTHGRDPEVVSKIAATASSIGTLKLIEDVLPDLTRVIETNTRIVKDIRDLLSRDDL